MKKILTFLIFICCVNSVFAQFTKAVVGINGLTCSQCSRSVEMGMKKMRFVETIEMDLENTTANLKFKNGVTVDFEALAKAVTNAGFSVRKMIVTYYPKNDDEIACIWYNGKQFSLVSKNEVKQASRPLKMLLIGDKFISIAEKNRLDLSTNYYDQKKCCFECCTIIPFVIVQ